MAINIEELDPALIDSIDEEIITAIRGARNDEELFIRLLDNPVITKENIDMVVHKMSLCFFHTTYDLAYRAIQHPLISDETLKFIVTHDADNDDDTIRMQ